MHVPAVPLAPRLDLVRVRAPHRRARGRRRARSSAAGAGGRPMGGMPGQGGQGSGPGPAGEEKEEAAEAAPENQGQEPALQPLPAWPGQREKALQFFQLNGYMRGRAYLFHQLQPRRLPGAAGPRRRSPSPTSSSALPADPPPARRTRRSCAARDNPTARRQHHLADMRLRLEPTINVSEQVRVKAQIDIFDNLVARLDARGLLHQRPRAPPPRLPLAGLLAARRPARPAASTPSRTRSASSAPGPRCARPFGELRFGRMPSHWGTGMFVNNGDCLDCDFGTNVDRVMFATKLWDHFLAFMWDWVATGPTTQIIDRSRARACSTTPTPSTTCRSGSSPLGNHGQARGAQGEARPGRHRLQLRRLLRLPPAELGPVDQPGQRRRRNNATVGARRPRWSAPRLGVHPRRLAAPQLEEAAHRGRGRDRRRHHRQPHRRLRRGRQARSTVDPVGRLRRQGRLQAAPRRAQDLPRGRLRLGRRLRGPERGRQLPRARPTRRSTTTSAASPSTPTTTST